MDPATDTPALLSARELRAWRGLLQVHAALTRSLDDDLQAAHGIGLSSYEVLLHVGDAEDGRLRMAQIADRVLLSRSGLTRLVDRLVRDGLLERTACPEDRRGAFAALTPAGRAMLTAARTTHLEGVRRRFLAPLSPEEQELLGDLMTKPLRSTT